MSEPTRPSLIAQGSPTSLAVVLPAVVAVAILLASIFAPVLVVEASRADFYLVTVFLGGGAAWLSGRAVASTWRGYRQAVIYALLLGCAVRFFHFALFEGTLFSLPHFITDTAFVLAISTLGFRAERAKQMATRYGWLYHQSGPFGWQRGAPDTRRKDVA